MRYFLTYRVGASAKERVFALTDDLTEDKFQLLCGTLQHSFSDRNAVLGWRSEDELKERDMPLLIEYRLRWKEISRLENVPMAHSPALPFLMLYRSRLAAILELDAPPGANVGTSNVVRKPTIRPLGSIDAPGAPLFELDGWRKRLQLHRDKDKPPTKYDFLVYRPDSNARDALRRLEVKYPSAVREIDDFLAAFNRCFDAFLKTPNQATRDALAQSEGELTRRLTSDLKIMIEHENQEPKQFVAADDIAAARATAIASDASATKAEAAGSKVDKRKAPLSLEDANAIAIKLFKKDKLFILKSQREWAKAIGIANERVPKLPLYQKSQPERDKYRRNKSRLPPTTSPPARTASWLNELPYGGEGPLDELIRQEEIARLKAEQDAEIQDDDVKARLAKKRRRIES